MYWLQRAPIHFRQSWTTQEIKQDLYPLDLRPLGIGADGGRRRLNQPAGLNQVSPRHGRLGRESPEVGDTRVVSGHGGGGLNVG